ncbi:MAG TPA: glutathione S-transferase N-terminal domain-containing protein [Solirubrobacteraceae bacterium]|jgi:glutathione S-transferase|nr:glutathione S-transferase N-terminal domain-containing protein [Solirubrobacteraceae bacterium]
MSQIKLYVLSGSHPCAAVEVAMERKGLPFKRVNLMPMAQTLIGPLRYGGATVPGMRVDGERLVGSRAIMRRIEELAPGEPPLLPAPADPARAQVLEAERWGDDVLQSVPRRILDTAFLRNPGSMESFAGDLPIPLPSALLRPTFPLFARMMAHKNEAREETARADIAALPGHLDKIDAWIAAGLLGGEDPNAADLQIGSSIGLLQTIADVRPLIEGHRAAELTRYFPPMVGEVPPGTLPAEWLPAPIS